MVIKHLEKLTKVNFTNGFLSAEEFEIRGSQCDLLISPLQKHFEYGTYKGSGSFGDAIFLRKKIILPSYVDPKKEFIDISIYYDNKDGLLNIFANIEDYVNMEISDKFYANYTTKAVFNKIKKELQLESLFYNSM